MPAKNKPIPNTFSCLALCEKANGKAPTENHANTKGYASTKNKLISFGIKKIPIILNNNPIIPKLTDFLSPIFSINFPNGKDKTAATTNKTDTK